MLRWQVSIERFWKSTSTEISLQSMESAGIFLKKLVECEGHWFFLINMHNSILQKRTEGNSGVRSCTPTISTELQSRKKKKMVGNGNVLSREIIKKWWSVTNENRKKIKLEETIVLSTCTVPDIPCQLSDYPRRIRIIFEPISVKPLEHQMLDVVN